MLIGVVRRIHLRVLERHVLLRRIEQVLQGRIRLQRHADGEALQEDLRDERTIFLVARLLLHERGEDNEFIDAQVLLLRTLAHLAREPLVEIVRHHREDAVDRDVAVDLVCIGEEKALGIVTRLVALFYIIVRRIMLRRLQEIVLPRDAFRIEALGNVLDGEALGNREAHLHRLPFDQDLQYIARLHIRTERIRADLEGVIRAVHFRRQPKLEAAMYNAAPFEHLCHIIGAHACTNRDIDVLLLLRDGRCRRKGVRKKTEQQAEKECGRQNVLFHISRPIFGRKAAHLIEGKALRPREEDFLRPHHAHEEERQSLAKVRQSRRSETLFLVVFLGCSKKHSFETLAPWRKKIRQPQNNIPFHSISSLIIRNSRKNYNRHRKSRICQNVFGRRFLA